MTSRYLWVRYLWVGQGRGSGIPIQQAPTGQVFGTSKYLLSTYRVPGAVPGAGGTAVKQNRQKSCLQGGRQ